MKAYKCPDCGDRVVLSHDDYVWECEGCPNEFLGTLTWLEAYVSE